MALPVAATVCIVLACWVVVVLVLFALYHFLKARGSCECECKPCGTEGDPSCTCCKSLGECCQCNPSLNSCLNSCCPKKKVSCIDCLLCQCCADEGQDSCLVKRLGGADGKACCTRCCVSCVDCAPVVCCCLEIRLVSKYSTDKSRSVSESSVNQSRGNAVYGFQRYG
ncbi:keratin-associated protein 5-1-like isoform X3 [Dreissena polymorpha]|uniref:keratin-associated protein 5-1-like isoform X3 n=1 Tax=Dreissena polymorpha TaxID=45954 RepID=UPI0022651B61|nr:keratin-associated protein 5-1-like isoform X3 [Dreissena polymorpha]